MGCCAGKSAVNPAAAAATGDEARAKHPLSKQNNPEGLTVLGTPDHIPFKEIRFKNRQGLSICVQRWLPKPPTPQQPGSEESKGPSPSGAGDGVRGCIVGLHGLNTHAGYTFNTVDYMYADSMLDYYNRRGYAVYLVDHQGHGKSEGLKPRTEHGHIGYVRSFDDIAMDIWTLVTTVVQEQYPTKPVVIHGHCMGGAHAMRALQLVPKPDRPKNLAGVILSAPSYMIPPEAKPSAFILKALGCLACCVPSMTVADWPDRNDASLDTRFYNDPYCTPTPFSAHYAHQLNTLYGHLATAYRALDLPILIAQGGEDTYVRPVDTKALFDAAVSPCKQYVFITDMNHGLLHEPGCERLFREKISWADKVVDAWNEHKAPNLPATAEKTITAGGAASKSGRRIQRVGSFLSWRKSSRNGIADKEVAAAHAAQHTKPTRPPPMQGIPAPSTTVSDKVDMT